MSRIGIVTDSTADMPSEFYERNDIKVVPLYVRFGEKIYKDWQDIKPLEFYRLMRRATELPKTSQPSVEDFLRVYESFKGYDRILSVHLSGELSGTIQSAELAAKSSTIPVSVIDGRQASIATGLLLGEIVGARDEGKSLEEIERVVAATVEKLRIVFYVDTLKYLEMGGRIGKAKYMAASLLKIRPVLTLADGEVAPYKNVKGKGKVIKEMAAFVKERAAGRPVKVGYVHADAPESIDELKTAVRESGAAIASEFTSEMGCVIGTYVGPGGFALVTLPA